MSQKKNNYRQVNGILLLDKPLNISSNLALQQARRIFQAAKAGHGGSLDMLATGLLPIFFGEATKFSQYLLNAKKRYLTVAKLGIKTSTADAEGQVIATQPVNVTAEDVRHVLKQFMGKTEQIPSMYSALKFQGKPLYELARRGITIEREARTIVIDQLDMLHFAHDEITLDVRCSKGTYIRNLVEDMGEALACGAHVKSLRRLEAGDFVESQMITLDKLCQVFEKENLTGLDRLLLPIDCVLQAYPAYHLAVDAVKKIQCGQIVYPTASIEAGVYRLYDEKGDFLGLGEVKDNGALYVKRLLSTAS